MVFSSINFLFFFLPITIFIYFSIRNKEFGNKILLASSIYFYISGEPQFIIIMLISLAVNYSFGLLVDYYQKSRPKEDKQKLVVMLCVIFNIGILFSFKYFNFMVDNINQIISQLGGIPIENEKISLPIGISFYTFHALSYVIDIYRKNAAVQKKFSDLALYILFFPQLIAGPIIRYHNISDQLTNREHNPELFAFGIRRFIIGLGKKVIMANAVGEVADKIFSLPTDTLSLSLSWLGIISYTFQIYYDFSGYSDMAIGLACLFGFRFPENFNYPYISESITEFWRRWHISLSNWFRDYLYISLGGNRFGTLKTYRNLFIVFICTGMWHGASWNFLIWGAYHGFFLVLEKQMNIVGFMEKNGKWLGRIYAISVVMVGWIFFRGDNIGYSIGFLESMFRIRNSGSLYDVSYFLNFKMIIILIIAPIGCTPFIDKIFLKIGDKDIGIKHKITRDIYILTVFLISILFLSGSTYNPFIYFRF